MKAELENKLIAVVRVRGRMGVRKSINETLERLHLNRVNSLALIYGTKSNLGMIAKCNDFVTFGIANKEMITKIFEKKDMKVSKENIDALVSGEKRAKDVVMVPIRMHPPKHGYEGTKAAYSNKGSLGFRGDAINDLLKRMI